MRHLDLFSGIGGFALAARWMNWQTVQFVEIDPFCQAVLKKNFKGVPIHGDIKTFDGTNYFERVDIISGGFPCQPFSKAGKRKGKLDDRFLWPEMLRVISEVKPLWIVGENVTGILSMEFEKMLIQMEDQGYRAEVYIIPACAIGATHQRDRVWIVANSSGSGGVQFRKWPTIQNGNRNDQNEEPRRFKQPYGIGGRAESDDWQEWEIEPLLCGDDDGISYRLDRNKSLGNAIHPCVAFEIFKAIEATMKPFLIT